MTQEANVQFFKWYLNWYENAMKDVMVFFSLPSKLTSFESDNTNDIILDIFEKRNFNTLDISAKPYLEQIIEGANQYEVNIYLEPIPRLYKIIDEGYKNKITREYLISYYKGFGFKLMENGFMVKKAKSN